MPGSWVQILRFRASMGLGLCGCFKQEIKQEFKAFKSTNAAQAGVPGLRARKPSVGHPDLERSTPPAGSM